MESDDSHASDKPEAIASMPRRKRYRAGLFFAGVLMFSSGTLAWAVLTNRLQSPSATNARTRADRGVSVGLEAYYVDHNVYPAWAAEPDFAPSLIEGRGGQVIQLR